MRSRALRMLVWEIILRNRWVLYLVVTALPIAGVLYPILASAFPGWSVMAGAGYLPTVLSVFLLYTCFAYGEVQPFPRRLFLLPLATRWLVLCPMIAGTLSLSVCYLSWQILVLHPVGLTAMSLGWPVVGIATAALWFQAVGWSFGKTPMYCVPILGVIGPVIILVAIRGQFAPTTGEALTAALGMALLAAAAVVLALKAVANHRHGVGFLWSDFQLKGFPRRGTNGTRPRRGTNGTRPRRGTNGTLPALPPPVRNPFSSPARAQFWFDWRLFGYRLPVLFAVMTGLLILMPLTQPGLIWGTELALVLLYVFLVGMVGFEMAKAQVGRRGSEMSHFWATRPMSDSDLARSRLLLCAATVGFTWLVCLLGMLLMILLTGAGEQASRLLSALVERWGTSTLVTLGASLLITVPMIAWSLSANAMCLSLTGRKTLVVTVAVVAFILPGMGFIAVAIRFRDPGELRFLLDWIPAVLGVPALLSAAVLTGALRCSARLRVSPAWNLKWVIGSGLTLAGIPGVAVVLSDLAVRHKLGVLLFVATLLLLGILPLCAAPIAIHVNRHR